MDLCDWQIELHFTILYCNKIFYVAYIEIFSWMVFYLFIDLYMHYALIEKKCYTSYNFVFLVFIGKEKSIFLIPGYIPDIIILFIAIPILDIEPYLIPDTILFSFLDFIPHTLSQILNPMSPLGPNLELVQFLFQFPYVSLITF